MEFKSQGILLREWDGIPISPKSVNLKNFKYSLQKCPKAEHFAETYLTFPTNKKISISFEIPIQKKEKLEKTS